jgi:ubiquitin-like protein Pup
MGEQVKKERQKSKQQEAEEQEAVAADLRDSGLTEDIDDLLDEIDDVLETNAEEFVKSYIQKGGQ